MISFLFQDISVLTKSHKHQLRKIFHLTRFYKVVNSKNFIIATQIATYLLDKPNHREIIYKTRNDMVCNICLCICWQGHHGHDRMVVWFTITYTICLSCLMLWVQIPLMARCIQYIIMWYSLSVTCSISMIFSGFSGFLHQ